MRKIIFITLGIVLIASIAYGEWKYMNPYTNKPDYYEGATTLDSRYLKLDASNDPLTGDLDFGTIDLYADSPLKLYVNNQLVYTWTVTITGDNFIFIDNDNFTLIDGNNLIFVQ